MASVGFINYKKNPTLLLYCFKKIYQYDPEYSLHIAGEFQEPRIQLYFEDFLKKNPLPIHFDNWVEDMPSWYADKDFIISTSLFESFHYSIAEGMSSGLMPLIHHWCGSDKLYPSEYLFNDPDDCLKLLKRMESENLHQRAIKNRQFICNRYMAGDKQAEISNLLAQLTAVGNIWQKK
ncbi:MAG: glycosyltransferase [bacterium]